MLFIFENQAPKLWLLYLSMWQFSFIGVPGHFSYLLSLFPALDISYSLQQLNRQELATS